MATLILIPTPSTRTMLEAKHMSKSNGDANADGDPLSRRGAGTSGRPGSPVLSSNNRE
jgi:hypothetical protein